MLRREVAAKYAAALKENRLSCGVPGLHVPARGSGPARTAAAAARLPHSSSGRPAPSSPARLADPKSPRHIGDRMGGLDDHPGCLFPELRRIRVVFPWHLIPSFRLRSHKDPQSGTSVASQVRFGSLATPG